MSFTADTYLHRLQSLQRYIPADTIWLLTDPLDLEYLTGFPYLVPEEREGFLLLTTRQARLLHAHFSPVRRDIPQLELVAHTSARALVQQLDSLRTSHTTLQADLTKLSALEYTTLLEASWSPTPLDCSKLKQQRMIKDAEELRLITEASQIACRAIQRLKSELTEGITELAASRRLEVLLLEAGSDKVAFPTIVAFGAHGALPHHQPTDFPLTKETAILVDFGASKEGYRSDMTRSWWFGDTPDQTFLEIESIVKTAYDLALQALRTDKVDAAAVDRAARQSITQAGYGGQFIHMTGHGVGLDIHEPPSLYQTNTETTLKPGMVITIEPGIYLESKFGYRYENTVALTTAEPLELTHERGVK